MEERTGEANKYERIEQVWGGSGKPGWVRTFDPDLGFKGSMLGEITRSHHSSLGQPSQSGQSTAMRT